MRWIPHFLEGYLILSFITLYVLKESEHQKESPVYLFFDGKNGQVPCQVGSCCMMEASPIFLAFKK